MAMLAIHSTPESTKIDALLRSHGINQWGVANNNPPLPLAPRLPRAITLLAGFQLESLVDLENGPTENYFIEYKRLNALLNKAANELVRHLETLGYSAAKVAATLEDYDRVVSSLFHSSLGCSLITHTIDILSGSTDKFDIVFCTYSGELGVF